MEYNQSSARLATVIYAAGLLVTIAVVFLIGLPFARVSHTWISISALFIGETALYALSLYRLPSRSGDKAAVPGYASLTTIAFLYLFAVVAIIVFFSLLWNVPTWSYALLHVIALGAAVIAGSLAGIAYYHADDQEALEALQTGWVKAMEDLLISMREELEDVQSADGAALKKSVAALAEKVRYSDPVSHPSLIVEESQLLKQVEKLSQDLGRLAEDPDGDGNAESLEAKVRQIGRQVENRNRQLLQLK